MIHFVEFTNWSGNKIHVNIENIVCVASWSNNHGDIITEISFDNSHVLVRGSLDEIMSKIYWEIERQ